RVAGGGQILRDRTLGFDEDPDVWNGAGTWPTTSLPSGWTTAGTWEWDDGPDVPNIFARSLKFTGIVGALTTSAYTVAAPPDWTRTYRFRSIVRTHAGSIVARLSKRSSTGSGWSDWESETV